jgi:16S rRNA (cytosine1407-C5)-methyltransferase
MTELPALPEAFVERLHRIIPPERLLGVLESFALRKPATLRINTLRAGVDETAAELRHEGFHLTPLPWMAEAFQVPAAEREALTHSAAADVGRIYLQNPASLLATLALAPRPGETVLDLAAAPGGKTLHMAALMGGQGRISAVESVRGRFFKLRANIDRGGASLVKTYLMDGRAVGGKVPGRFDRVLLDAPCSSEARFSRLRPASWQHWGPRKIREMARKQQGLLLSGFRALKSGGVLLYCTCSFAPEENERVVAELLGRYPHQLAVEKLRLAVTNTQEGLTQWEGQTLDGALSGCARILPDSTMDGLFLCRLRRLS